MDSLGASWYTVFMELNVMCAKYIPKHTFLWIFDPIGTWHLDHTWAQNLKIHEMHMEIIV